MEHGYSEQCSDMKTGPWIMWRTMVGVKGGRETWKEACHVACVILEEWQINWHFYATIWVLVSKLEKQTNQQKQAPVKHQPELFPFLVYLYIFFSFLTRSFPFVEDSLSFFGKHFVFSYQVPGSYGVCTLQLCERQSHSFLQSRGHKTQVDPETGCKQYNLSFFSIDGKSVVQLWMEIT